MGGACSQQTRVACAPSVLTYVSPWIKFMDDEDQEYWWNAHTGSYTSTRPAEGWDWEQHLTEDGSSYYFWNQNTKESAWNLPMGGAPMHPRFIEWMDTVTTHLEAAAPVVPAPNENVPVATAVPVNHV